jgi:hypothetical protein
MSRLATVVIALACIICCASAFAPLSGLPMGLSARRSVAARGPTCLIAPGQISTGLPLIAEPLTVLAGRGDRRTKRGKRKSHSFGKVKILAKIAAMLNSKCSLKFRYPETETLMAVAPT